MMYGTLWTGTQRKSLHKNESISRNSTGHSKKLSPCGVNTSKKKSKTCTPNHNLLFYTHTMTINNYDDCIYPIHDLPTEAQKEVQENDLSYGEMLRKAIDKNGFTLQKLGKKIGLSHASIHNYCNNVSVPREKTRKMIEVLLGVSVDIQEEYILKTQWREVITYRNTEGILVTKMKEELKQAQREYNQTRAQKKQKKKPRLLPLAKKIQKEVQEERSESPIQKGSHPLTALLTQAEKGTVFLYHNNDLYSLSKV